MLFKLFLVVVHIIVNLQGNIAACEVSENALLLKSNCICPGYILTLECTVNGTSFGTTIWRGDFFDCNNGIILLHNKDRFTAEKRHCNGGAISGQGLAINGSFYSSQLNIAMNDSINGRRVECLYNFDEEIFVDSLIINGTGPFSPPLKLFVSEANLEEQILTFTWSTVTSDCPAIRYDILASNCGSCPTTTTDTNVTCTDVPTDGNGACTFAVQTVVCRNITGDRSDQITVRLTKNCPQDTLIDPKESLSIFIIGIALLIGTTILAGLCIGWKVMKKMLCCSTSRELHTTANQENEVNYYTVKIFDNEKMGTYGLDDEPQSEIDCKSDENILRDKPDLNSILHALHKSQVIPNWYLFGLAIGVPKKILDQLRVQDYTDKDCLIEVIDHWLRHHYSQPTWKEIIEAKKKIEFYNLAKTIPHK